LAAGPVSRVAHAYGNSRDRIELAVGAGVELIEADLRYRHGAIDVRHDYRLPVLPLLYNRGLRGIHKRWPWAISFGSTMVRLDIGRISLAELLRLVSGRGGLMLDLKRDTFEPGEARCFGEAVLRQIDATGFDGRIAYCGYWPLLDAVAQLRPDAQCWYSLDTTLDCEHLLDRLSGATRIERVTVQRDLLTPERAAALRAARIEFYAWDIEDALQAERAIDLGATGIIADDLAMMAGLRHPARHATES